MEPSAEKVEYNPKSPQPPAARAAYPAGPAAAGSKSAIHALLDALPAAVYTTDAGGRLTYYNDAAAQLWGRRPPLGATRWCGAWKLFTPDGKPLPHDESPMAIALKERRPVRNMEVEAERPDGTRVSLLPHPTPLFDDGGRLTGGIDMLIDLSERKRTENQQALLLRELHHRVKNTLATVQAIMSSTARSAGSVEEFKSALIGRIGALARTHLLLAEEGKSVDFSDILRSELDAFDDGDPRRLVLDGPPIAITPRLAFSLGMAVHELTTNAARYGALSVHGGRVAITWRVVNSTRRRLVFDWVESGGPRVSKPTRVGFGTRLLRVVMPGQLQAKTRVKYAPEGVRVHYEVPLPAEGAA